MKFTCTVLPTVGKFPRWCEAVAIGKDKSLCQINYSDESLIDDLNLNNPESAINFDELLENLGFQNVEWQDVPLKVKDGCYLSRLNSILQQSDGIPFLNYFPSLLIQNKLCFEIDLSGRPKKVIALAVDVYKGDKVPVSLWFALSYTNLMAVPADLVEELVPDEVQDFLARNPGLIV